ncbi:hypothetical protein GCM10017083_07110 [Thalassobaculum fulvum]|uniref:DUF4055 domain-containing protein n=1 Tax=Thalassobaculum fulvum TaxID=1633335 RepID=A0A918XP01_9PROT|nr:DUF4055 domain-containing protein [Thalassobaculum fulvum]GHD42276.1 hypothetical protein GCM10017083_07110 [Thalassobaculum fulvum]
MPDASIGIAGGADVATPNAAWAARAPDWELIRDLLGGTRAMREAGERRLPREPGESLAAYRIRLARTVLFNGLGRAVQTLSGKPFGKPATLSDDADPRMRAMTRDLDLGGRDLTGLARDVLRAALTDGLTHILVDYPAGGGAGETLADERARGARPYLVHVPAPDLIGWRAGPDGRLDRVRIRETVLERDGAWGERAVEQIRVLEPGRWSLWRRSEALKDRPWRRHAGGETSLDAVPLVTVYAERTGFLTARPPLLDLAWLNLAHWQSSSDQRHILHVARVPILFGRNLKVGEDGIEIGPNRLILGDGDGADLKYVEHGGAAIEAGRQDLADLEDRMAVMGLDLMVRRSGGITATERAIDAARADSALAALVRAVEEGLTAALALCARWMDLAPEAAGRVTLDPDTGLDAREAEEIDLLLKARLAGEIDRPTFLAEIRRRGVLAAA